LEQPVPPAHLARCGHASPDVLIQMPRHERKVMQGRKNYTKEEIEQGRAAIGQQLAAYKELAEAMDSAARDKTAGSSLESFEALFFNNMTLVLDRYFVHRLPGPNYEGKDGNPLNEVRIICDSLVNNNGIMRGDKQIKLVPERSVLKLHVGDRINLTGEEFERLSAAFFDELERRFL
jgi:hypothetical protein